MFKFLFAFFVFQSALFATEKSTSKSKEKSLVFLGDSLTEGYGVDQSSAYSALIQKKIMDDKLNWKVVNSGISGSTSASGPGRAKWLLKSKNIPDLVVVVLGGNDGLRGLPTDAMKKNLDSTIKVLKDAKINSIIAEIYVPPNYGKDYTDKFKKVFSDVAAGNSIPLMPFLLEKVAGKTELNLADGIHPNEKGHKIIADGIYIYLKKHLN